MKNDEFITSSLLLIGFAILEEMGSKTECSFNKKDVYKAADSGRMLDFICEMTGKDGLLSGIINDADLLADINERLSHAVGGGIANEKIVVSESNGLQVLMGAVLIALQVSTSRK